MSISYGQEIIWTNRDGSVMRTSSRGHSTPDQAMDAAMSAATAFGWKPAKWWQWWRWGDPKYDVDRLKDMGVR